MKKVLLPRVLVLVFCFSRALLDLTLCIIADMAVNFRRNILGKSKLITGLRPDVTSNFVYGLTFGIPKFYIALYGTINHEPELNLWREIGPKTQIARSINSGR